MVGFLEEALHPLGGADPELPAAELSALDNLAKARVIGLGEASHGTHEFFQVKARLIRYLVENHGVRGIGFEIIEFGQSLAFDRYITTGEGDLETLMRDRLAFWLYRTEAVRDLLRWLRAYNEEKPAAEQVRFFGIDATNPNFQAATLEARIREHFPGLADSVAVRLADYPENLNQYYLWDEATLINNRGTVTGSIQAVLRLIDDFFEELTDLSSPQEAALIRRLAEAIEQTEVLTYNSPYNRTNAELFREQFLAENATWISEHLGGAKAALWAHNGHVAVDNNWQGNGPGSMGYRLRQDFGGDYQAIATSKGKGSFHAASEPMGPNPSSDPVVFTINAPAENSTNDLFSRADADVYFVLLDELTADPDWAEWCRASQPFLNLGVIHSPAWTPQRFAPIRLSDQFDAVVHFDETTASRLLE